MTISTTEKNDSIIITLPEKFTFQVQSEFRRSYEEQENGKDKHYILDFSKVHYMDSSALGMMLLLHDFVSANTRDSTNKIKIQHCEASIKDILEIANFQSFFEIT